MCFVEDSSATLYALGEHLIDSFIVSSRFFMSSKFLRLQMSPKAAHLITSLQLFDFDFNEKNKSEVRN